jgi:hypothetical protein
MPFGISVPGRFTTCIIKWDVSVGRVWPALIDARDISDARDIWLFAKLIAAKFVIYVGEFMEQFLWCFYDYLWING